MPRVRTILAFLAALGVALPAAALDYRSVAVPVAILYDAPSVQARRIALLSRFYPVEVIVTLEKWVKVRDATGALAWVEADKLAQTRTLLVTVPVATVREAPSATAAVVFQAEKDVALELLEIAGNGWVRVRHRDGQSGYVEIGQVWGL
jgi:SH3-like domain-containing protein